MHQRNIEEKKMNTKKFETWKVHAKVAEPLKFQWKKIKDHV
jgi:hypothetical protein